MMRVKIKPTYNIFTAAVLGVSLAFLITRIVAPANVIGESMVPSYSDGDLLLTHKVAYVFDEPKRGDIVLIGPLKGEESTFLKRVIAIPGDTIRFLDNTVYINGEPIKEEYLKEQMYFPDTEDLKLKENEYYVMGDNRNISFDSRDFGPISIEDIRGQIIGAK